MRTAEPRSVACDLCGADDAEPFLTLTDRMIERRPDAYRLVRCRRCGLLSLDPRPTADALAAAYPDDYAPFARSGLAARVKAALTGRAVRELWPLLGPPARVLDLGCATGDLLEAVRECGNANVIGVEPSERAASVARSARGLEVHAGDLESARLPTGSVDVALLSHVIEHLPAPSATLDELRRVLRPGGALVLWLPNADSLAARVLRERWIGYDAPRHLHTYSVATLAATLARHGFTVRDVRHERIGLEWSWAVRFWARERLGRGRADRLLGWLHPASTAAFTPLAAGAAMLRQAGRVRVVARAEPFAQAAAGSASTSSAMSSRAASASRASLRSPKR